MACRCGGKYPKLTGWVEGDIETSTYFRLLPVPRKQMNSTNMLERLNEKIRWRIYVVRIFAIAESLPWGWCER
ncbi:transposase [Bradyrhizobium brasilense]|uniref:Transposase n=1 Tax=Bradyrhizobium brasilense TaxID=1419277 RepID=A0ABY8JBP7_9BRAD|nr:transposase [Bradyrhizobium brasilense]WFU62543.1 transposase [Bradyrhizobium brasilense]